MSDLLQQFSSFLSINKLVAISLPGLIVACALLLFFNPSPCNTDPEKCWFCMGQQNPDVTQVKSTPSRPEGSYLASKLRWRSSNQFKLLAATATETHLEACGDVPEYIVIASRMKADTDANKNLGDLEAVDPRFLVEALDRCSAALTQALAEIKRKDSAESALITQSTTALGTLMTQLTVAQGASNLVLEESLRQRVKDATKTLEQHTQRDQLLQGATSAGTAFAQQITTERNSLYTDVSTSVPADPKPPKSTWQSAAQAISNNVLMFLTVVLAAGLLLDPIQRAFVSLDPLRGVTFPFLNLLYKAEQSVGMVRFGDQRYQSTRSPELEPLLAREPNLLEPSYAIGRGLLTQAEYGSLEDQFYSQSQVTTGLIIPLAGLAAVVYFRLLCCKLVQPGSGIFLWAGLTVITLLVPLCIFMQLTLSKGEKESREKSERYFKEMKLRQLRGLEDLEGNEDNEDVLKAKATEIQARRQQRDCERAEYRRERDLHMALGREFAKDPAHCIDTFRDYANEELQLLVMRREVRTKQRVHQYAEWNSREQYESGERNIRAAAESGSRWRSYVALLVILLITSVVAALIILCHLCLGDWWLAGLGVGVPTLEILCLAAGIDRLHRFYSEVQARIVGAARKQDDSQTKKFADLLTDAKAKLSFLDELKKRRKEIDDILGPLHQEPKA